MIGKVNSIESMGLVDGPGVRFVVFMQGCPLRCKFCHNPETWDLNGKANCYTPEELIKKILNYKPYFKHNGGVTFSGGEPLMQKEFLLECLKLCKENKMAYIDRSYRRLYRQNECLYRRLYSVYIDVYIDTI